MAIHLIDTNVFSFIFRRDKLAPKYLPYITGHSVLLSFMTVAELYDGALKNGWDAAKFAKLETALKAYDIVESCPDICRHWASVRHQRRAQPISVDDAWIAATALYSGAKLVTHNPADFANITGLNLITEVP